MCVAEIRGPSVEDDSEFFEPRRRGGMLILLAKACGMVRGVKISRVRLSNGRDDDFRDSCLAENSEYARFMRLLFNDERRGTRWSEARPAMLNRYF